MSELVLFDLLLLRSERPMVLGQVVGILLIRTLGEDSLLPQVGGQVGVGLGDGGVSGLSCNEKDKKCGSHGLSSWSSPRNDCMNFRNMRSLFPLTIPSIKRVRASRTVQVWINRE